MRRREFISLVGGFAAGFTQSAHAQQSKIPRIGALYIGLADAELFKKELREGLRELGYVEGKNIAFEFRSAEGKLDQLPDLASELARLKVDVIVALYVPCALAAKQATREIPIVIVAGDPIETGIVAGLAHPGGNITGVNLMSAVLVGKCVELFHDMLPGARHIAVLTNDGDSLFAKLVIDHVNLAGRTTGVKIQPMTVPGPDEGLDATTHAFVDAGGLMSYGADGPALFRLSAKFVHRILQGAQPNDLPIEQPTKFELAVNLKAAKAMGLKIPEAFLARADTLLE
jgi:putative tryptophan/tyrosine transport system substrate-binding protein